MVADIKRSAAAHPDSCHSSPSGTMLPGPGAVVAKGTENVTVDSGRPSGCYEGGTHPLSTCVEMTIRLLHARGRLRSDAQVTSVVTRARGPVHLNPDGSEYDI